MVGTAHGRCSRSATSVSAASKSFLPAQENSIFLKIHLSAFCFNPSDWVDIDTLRKSVCVGIRVSASVDAGESLRSKPWSVIKPMPCALVPALSQNVPCCPTSYPSTGGRMTTAGENHGPSAPSAKDCLTDVCAVGLQATANMR